MPVRGPGHRRGHGRGGRLPRGQPARRGARLVQLPRRLPAHGRWTAAGSTTAASPRWCRCSLAREMAGEAGIVVAVDCNSGTRWPAADSFVALALRAGLTLLRGRTRGELSGADLVIAPAMGESGWMRPRKIPRFFAAGRRGRSSRRCPSCGGCSEPDGEPPARRRAARRCSSALAVLPRASGDAGRRRHRRLARGRGPRAALRDGRRPARPLRARRARAPRSSSSTASPRRSTPGRT